MRMSKTKKLNWQLAIATLLTLVGIGLLIAGFCVAPLGVIDTSVLIGFGELLTFVGALSGVDYHYKFKMITRNDDE